MTEQARCEPREADRGRDGWHWLSCDGRSPYPIRWISERSGEYWEGASGPVAPREAARRGNRYLHPVSPHDPADLARLVEAARVAQRNFDPNGYAYGELHTALAAFTAKEI